MKRIIILLIVIGCFPVSSSSSWLAVPLDQLVQDSDLIVVGVLDAVVEHTIDGIDYGEGLDYYGEGIDYGEGTINVGEVLWGKANPGSTVILKWQNPSARVCPRVGHRQNENKSGIWLLTSEDGGVVRANYPGRFVELRQRAIVKRFLEQKKVCLRGNKSVVSTSEPIDVSLVFRNPTQSQIQFPGLEYRDGYLYVSPGIKLTVTKDWGDHAEVSLLASRVFLSKDLQPITVEPGQEHRTVIELSQLLDVVPGQSHALSVKIEGYALSNKFGFFKKHPAR